MKQDFYKVIRRDRFGTAHPTVACSAFLYMTTPSVTYTNTQAPFFVYNNLQSALRHRDGEDIGVKEIWLVNVTNPQPCTLVPMRCQRESEGGIYAAIPYNMWTSEDVVSAWKALNNSFICGMEAKPNSYLTTSFSFVKLLDI